MKNKTFTIGTTNPPISDKDEERTRRITAAIKDGTISGERVREIILDVISKAK